RPLRGQRCPVDAELIAPGPHKRARYLLQGLFEPGAMMFLERRKRPRLLARDPLRRFPGQEVIDDPTPGVKVAATLRKAALQDGRAGVARRITLGRKEARSLRIGNPRLFAAGDDHVTADVMHACGASHDPSAGMKAVEQQTLVVDAAKEIEQLSEHAQKRRQRDDGVAPVVEKLALGACEDEDGLEVAVPVAGADWKGE